MSDLALAAVQLALGPGDVTSEQAFGHAIDQAAEAAAVACGHAEHRLLVFPEAVGHVIPLIHAPALARRQRTMNRAMAVLLLSRPAKVLGHAWRARTTSLSRAVLLASLGRADDVMRRIFSAVARRHRAYVVAGSHLSAIGGAVTNTSYTFDPEGRLVASTDKVNLVRGLEDDAPGGLGLTRGDAERVPVVDAPWGRLATLICYDGFRRPHTAGETFSFMPGQADARRVDVIANPAANPWPWHGPWVHAAPGSPMLRREQWQTEGLPASMQRLGHVTYGVTAQLCARILDMHFEGVSEILVREGGEVTARARARSHDAAEVVVARVPAPVQASLAARVPSNRS